VLMTVILIKDGAVKTIRSKDLIPLGSGTNRFIHLQFLLLQVVEQILASSCELCL